MGRRTLAVLASIAVAGAILFAAGRAWRDRAPAPAGADGDPEAAAHDLCRSRPEGSRWASAGRDYVRTALYGRQPDGWLASVAGIATAPDGEVLVFDATSARIVVLSEHLQQVREFGRRGAGPGELSPPRGFGPALSRYRFLDVTDSAVYVYDGEAVEVFARDGTFRRQIGGLASGFVRPFTLLSIRRAGPELLYAYDSLDIRRPGERRLQTWSIAGERRTLLFELPLERPPAPGGMAYAHAREARPLWASHGRCVVVADGSSRNVLVHDRASGRGDTLRLSPHPVPPVEEMSEEEADALARVRDVVASRGFEMPDLERWRPAAIWRWTDLIVDPDGVIWIRPWRSPDDPERRIGVLRLNPRSGRVRRDTVPAFPKAFGAPGVYYAVETHPSTEELLVTRYERRSPET